MEIGARIPDHGGIEDIEFSQRAEDDWEYESVWAGELWGSDIFVRLTQLATQTERIGLGVGIANVFSRSPAVLAMAGASLQEVSDGRVLFGVGPGTGKTIEDLHGIAFERPIRRVHETVELIRSYTRQGAEPITYNGELFEVADFHSLEARFPIYNAALGAANRRVTGRLCDGWLPHNIPFTNLEGLFEKVRTAARDADRDPNTIEVRPYVPVAVDDNPQVAYDNIRKHIAYYVGNSTGYKSALDQAFPESMDGVAGKWKDGRHDEAADLVSDSIVDVIGVAGDPKSARDSLRELYERPIIDALNLVVPLQADRELILKTFEELSPCHL
jgi:alkanesulfonate monooxygenase SsuD/methylene tetrahydromethanopterin reductase-like flavin-dependent oxidoreductase (luciferase family)